MTSTPRKAAVMGWPVSHSLSPRLHTYWLKHYNIEGSYTAMPVEPKNLEQALKNLPGEGFRGVNLTIPHKEAAMAIIKDRDSVANKVGAINTVIVHDNGRLEGCNTDVFGFKQNLQTNGFDRTDRPAVVLGAGGAARAAIVALREMQITEIRIVNRTFARAEELAESMEGDVRAYEWDDATVMRDAELLVNATSLGLKGHPEVDLNLEKLPTDATVTDMVYAPLTTGLLQRAQNRGNPTIDGLGMLLHQARLAFAAFFGQDPEVTPELRRHVMQPLLEDR